jgi:hypothetical protein
VWQKLQAFFVAFVYSGLPYEAVEQTRKPPSTKAAGTMSFNLDIQTLLPTIAELQFHRHELSSTLTVAYPRCPAKVGVIPR